MFSATIAQILSSNVIICTLSYHSKLGHCFLRFTTFSKRRIIDMQKSISCKHSYMTKLGFRLVQSHNFLYLAQYSSLYILASLYRLLFMSSFSFLFPSWVKYSKNLTIYLRIWCIQFIFLYFILTFTVFVIYN